MAEAEEIEQPESDAPGIYWTHAPHWNHRSAWHAVRGIPAKKALCGRPIPSHWRLGDPPNGQTVCVACAEKVLGIDAAR